MASNNILIEDARLIFRNFAGREEKYNREGDRNFAVVLDEELAEKLEKLGCNVKRKPPKEEGDAEFIYMSVKVSFKGRPPRLIMITKSKKKRNTLDKDTCELLDYAEFEKVDLILNPYSWTVNGKTGTSVYVETMYATLFENELDLKYAEYEDERLGEDIYEGSEEDRLRELMGNDSPTERQQDELFRLLAQKKDLTPAEQETLMYLADR